MIEIRDISFSYNGSPLLKNISMNVKSGERVRVLAPSGFGKTTLCRIAAGYLSPDAGEVLVEGKPLPKKGVCPVQMILQHPEAAVDPRMRMQETLMEAGEIDERNLKRFGIKKEWLSRFPHELSGGELQRFCIVRALAASPSYLIADEISTMLDAVTQAQIWRGLLEEVEKRALGLIVVTHSEALAKRVASRSVQL